MTEKIYFLLIILLSCSCKKENSVASSWQLEEQNSLPIRTSNQAVSEGFIKNQVYIYSFGGIDSTKLYSGIHQRSFRMNLSTEIWEEIPSLPDSLGKIANAASRINDTIYILGGYHVFEDGHEKSSNKVHRYQISQNKYLEDGAPIPLAIDDHVQVIWKNKLIYLITGWSDKENVVDVQIYNPGKNTWLKGTPVPDNHDYKSFGASGSIVGDTIYYFGGAAMGKFYPIQNYLRKGVINPKKPTEIIWSKQIIDPQLTGYRMASFSKDNIPVWVGGSSTTYNFNGIAYNKSGGVQPNKRILSLTKNNFNKVLLHNLPMDLRGIATINDSTKYLIGGMEAKQKVTDKVFKLEWK